MAAIVLIYWRSMKVCRSGCVRRTHLEQASVSSTRPRKYIDTKLGGIHRPTSWVAASPLIFNCIAAIVLVYMKVCSSGCVRCVRTHLEQISVSSTPPWKCIAPKLGGASRTTSRAAASPLIFNRRYYSCHSISILERQEGDIIKAYHNANRCQTQ